MHLAGGGGGRFISAPISASEQYGPQITQIKAVGVLILEGQFTPTPIISSAPGDFSGRTDLFYFSLSTQGAHVLILQRGNYWP